jgi:WD40 repeat protein
MTGEAICILKGHLAPVSSVAFNHDGRRVVSGSHDNTVKIWNAETAKILQTLEGHTFYVNSVAFNHDGTQIISGSSDWTIRIWEDSKTLARITLNNVEMVMYGMAGKYNANFNEVGIHVKIAEFLYPEYQDLFDEYVKNYYKQYVL